MNIIANQDKIGTSKLELYVFKTLYLLTFKKSEWLRKQVIQVRKDLEAVKSKRIY